MSNLVKKFMTSALLGFGALLSSGAALSREVSSEDKPHSLHISTETLNLIGGENYGKKLVEWAGMNVLLLTEKDINTVMAEKADASISDELKKVYPSFPVELADQTMLIEMAAGIVFDASSSTYGFKTKNASANTHCVIVMPSSIQQSNEWFGLSSYQDVTTIENVTSSPQFWFSMLLAHEVHHCRLDVDAFEKLPKTEKYLEAIQREANADQFALQVHKDANPEDLRDWMQARAIGSMKHENGDYIFAGSLSTTTSSKDMNAQDIFNSHLFIWKKISDYTSLNKADPISLRSVLNVDQIYTIVKDIHQKGGFDENPIARKNIELFIEGMEQHAPSVIKSKPVTGLKT